MAGGRHDRHDDMPIFKIRYRRPERGDSETKFLQDPEAAKRYINLHRNNLVFVGIYRLEEVLHGQRIERPRW